MKARELAALLLVLPDPEAEVDLTGAYGKIQPLRDIEFVTDAAFGRVQLRVPQMPRSRGDSTIAHRDERPAPRPGARNVAEALAMRGDWQRERDTRQRGLAIPGGPGH